MADQIDQLIKLLKLDLLDSNNSLSFVKEKVGLRPSQLAFAIIVFLLIIIIIAQASTIVLAIACYLIPAYFTVISLGDRNHDNDVKYSTYWVLFMVLEIFEFLFRWPLGLTLYTFVRVAFTVAMLHPQLQLAQTLYYKVISPYVMGYEVPLDVKIQQIVHQNSEKF